MEFGGSRAAFRGEPEVLPALEDTQDALVAEIDADGPLDVEVIEPEPITPDEPERGSQFDTATPPPDGLMSYDAAASAAKIHQARRAPPHRR